MKGFEDITGARTFIAGKTSAYANGALYLKRKNHPSDEKRRLAPAAGPAKTFGKVEGVVQLVDKATVTLKRVEGDFSELNYQPNQLHVHAPSEHTINDQYYDLEMHFVMLPIGETAAAHKKFVAAQKAKDGEFNYKVNYGVLGVMFTETDCKDVKGKAIKECASKLAATEAFFGSMELDKIPVGRASPAESPNAYWGAATSHPLKKMMESLDTRTHYAYNGSLTTPPCWEGVRWTVLHNALPISAKIMKLIRRNFDGNRNFAGYRGNNRVIQKRNERKLYYAGASTVAASMTALALTAYLF